MPLLLPRAAKSIHLTLIWALLCVPIYAEREDKLDLTSSSTRDKSSESMYKRADEYFSEEVPGETLITVQLIGSVPRAGVYHVPRNTDVVKLLSLAGGTREEANLRKILIKRRNQAKEEVHEIDVEAIAEKANVQSPLLQTGDMVLVYAKEPLVTHDTISFLTVLTTILSIVTSTILLTKSL